MTTLAINEAFDVETSARSLGRNLPQRLGRRLWLPMLLMGLMAFPVGLVLGFLQADEIADGGSAVTIQQLRHIGAGVMFIGFASVFAAISFAIARILGEFRQGGGDVQEAAGRTVQTLRMPLTAKLFLGAMAVAMTTVLTAVVLHFVFAADIANTPASLEDSEQRFIVLEGIRRIGVAIYLIAITLGLGTIIHVLRFQSIRIRQLVSEPRAS
jgi:hypothetical protein